MADKRATRKALTPREQSEAEARARAWAKLPAAPPKRKPKPVKVDKTQAERALAFNCPTCGARVGQYCKTPDRHVHARRLAKATVGRAQPNQKGSVRAIPSAIETNPRRH